MYHSDPQKNKFIGKIAAIGQGGSGKTYMINSLANYIAKKDIYIWDEESAMPGTIGVTPYTLDFNDVRKRIVINDNPGQDSLDMVRRILASQGDVYQGLCIVCDSIGWNFRKIGVFQAISISEFTKFERLSYMPVILVISKRDLHQKLLNPQILDKISDIFEKAANSIEQGREMYFRNRAFNRNGTFTIDLVNHDLIPFTIMEQVLTNALDLWMASDPIIGFTKMNIRLFVRSFLLGYCEAMKSVINIAEYPVFSSLSDPRLVNKLNYHRPTAYETATGWNKLGGDISEPPILRSVFNKTTIKTILKNFVLANESEISTFIDEVKSIGLQHRWKVVDYTFTDSVTRNGKENLISTFKTIMDDIEQQTTNTAKTFIHSRDTDLGLDEF